MTRTQLVTGIAVVVAVGVGAFFFIFIPKKQSMDSTNVPSTSGAQLIVQDEEVGTGAVAKAGDTVSVNYTGKFKDGTVFDASAKHGGPIDFQIGVGRVIQGWDQGIPGMKVGGKRLLIVPPELGYGPNDYGPIPGNSTLVFEVELVGIKPASSTTTN